MNKKTILIVAILLAGASFFLFKKLRTNNVSEFVTVKITQEGKRDSPQAQVGDTITLHYTNSLENGTKLDSTVDQGIPFTFKFGETQILKGWTDS